MTEKSIKIIEACMLEHSKNPIEIFNNIAHKEFVNITDLSTIYWTERVFLLRFTMQVARLICTRV